MATSISQQTPASTSQTTPRTQSAAAPQPAAPSRSPLVTGLTVVGLLAVGAVASPFLSGLMTSDKSANDALAGADTNAETAAAPEAESLTVTLSPAKLAAAGL